MVLAQNGVSITSAVSIPTQQNPVPVTFTFEQPVNDFEKSDISVLGGEIADLFVEYPDYDYLGFKSRLGTVRSDNIFNLDYEALNAAVVAIDTDLRGRMFSLSFGDGVWVHHLQTDGQIEDKNQLIAPDNFSEPRDLLVSGGNIYIADAGNDRLVVYNISSGTIRSLGNGLLNAPSGLASDQQGVIFIADTENKRVISYHPDSDTFGPAIGTQELISPIRLAVDPGGNLYVNDQGEVKIFGPSGIFKGTLGNMGNAGSLVVDSYGFLYVVDLEDTNLDNIIDYSQLDLLDVLGFIGRKFGIKVFRTDDLGAMPVTISEQLNIPVDLALYPCGELAVNNGDAKFDDEGGATLSFDLMMFQRLPKVFRTELTVTEECTPASVQIPAGSAELNTCTTFPTQDTKPFTVVWDETSPVLDCSAEPQIELNADEQGVYRIPNLAHLVSDLCDGQLAISQNPLPGTVVEEDGEIYLQASDDAGNNNDCRLSYILNDEPEPAFTCLKYFTVELDENGVGEVDATDLIEGDSTGVVFQPNQLQFTCGDIGENQVQLNYSGVISGSCSVLVYVKDVREPVFTSCLGDDIQYIEESENGRYIVPDFRKRVMAEDNCSQDLTYTQSILPGTEITEGTYIHIFAYDEYGNESVSCSFEVALSPAEPSFECASAEGETVKVDENCQYEQRDFSHLIINEKNFVDGMTTEQTEVLNGDTLNVKIRVYHGEANDPDKTFIGECVFEIPVVDQNLPQILSCDASEVTVSMSSGESYEIPDFSSRITGADNCSFEIVQSPSPGTRITETETVKLWLEDPAGNRSSTTCEFKVILQEKEPLMITSCPETDQLTLGENCEAELPDYTQQVETDGEPVTLAQLPAPGSVITGRTEVKITATGSSGETDSCTFWVELEDDMPPAITCITELSFSYDPEFGYEVPDLSSMLEISDNCGFSVRQVPAPGTVISNSQEIEIVAVDMAGNETLCSFQLNLQATSSFLINCPKAQTGFLEENCAVEVPDFRSKTQVTNPEAVVTQNPPPGTLVTSRTTIEMIATAGDLRATCQFDFEVVDNLKPEISCTPISINLDAEGTATITPEMLAQFEDNCGIVQAEVSKSSFTEEHLGSQPVTVTVRDAAGNENQCVTTVQVEPYEGISEGFKCPEPTTIALKSNGELNISVYYPGEAELEFEISQSHFTCADIGTHTLTITYTGDFNGTCEAELTVIDDTPPEIVCLEEYTLTLNSEGKAVVKAEDLLSKAYDNCGIADAVLSRNAFSTADIGQQEISLTVTDQSGNVSTCLVPLQVRAYEASPDPFTCVEALTLELDPEGHAKLNPRDLFSGGASVQFSVDKEEFTCDDLGTTIVTLTYSTPEESGSCQIPVTIIDPEERCNAGPVEPPLEEVFLLLYPNPNEGIFNITGTRKIILERAEVFDARGRFLFARKLEKPDGPKMVYRFDLTEFQSGVYTIKLYAKDEIFIRRAIIRNE